MSLRPHRISIRNPIILSMDRDLTRASRTRQRPWPEPHSYPEVMRHACRSESLLELGGELRYEGLARSTVRARHRGDGHSPAALRALLRLWLPELLAFRGDELLEKIEN